MKELNDIIQHNPAPDHIKLAAKKKMLKSEKKDFEDSSTSEEMFLHTALRSVTLHSKAKILIFKLIDEMKFGRKKDQHFGSRHT